ncbi:MAG: SLBB domain-containing protein [Candidatus Electrothrix gigas]
MKSMQRFEKKSSDKVVRSSIVLHVLFLTLTLVVASVLPAVLPSLLPSVVSSVFAADYGRHSDSTDSTYREKQTDRKIGIRERRGVRQRTTRGATQGKAQAEYAIGAGDVLSIKVYGYDELTVKVRVTEAGTIDFPLIGEVQVGGLGISAAARRIERALADGYLVEPQVNIFIEQFKSKKVIVLGPVHNPGLIELKGSINLLELISQVGGLKNNAGETVTIKRQVNGRQKKIPINLDRLIKTGDPALNIQIMGGDTVSIAEGAVCFVTGEVNQPGEYPCGRNMTVLKVVSQAGSFTNKALESAIKINRTVNGVKRVLRKVNQDTIVLPDDVIIVPQRTVSKEDELLCFISGEVKRPGAYPCSERTNILKLLTRAGGFTKNALKSGIQINRQINGRKRVFKKVNKDTLLRPEDIVVVPANSAKAVCYITGQVNKPGAYPCDEKTTVLKMVSLAGSFTGIAAESRIQINRIVNGRKQVLKNVADDTLVQPEDVVVVPESLF